MAKKSKKANEDTKYTAIGIVFCAIVAVVVVIIIAINSGKPKEPETISTYDAQKKCVIMETAGGLTVDNARKYCLSQWNTPEKQEEFPVTIQAKWQEKKDTKINAKKLTGKNEEMSLEDIYNSIEGDI